MHNHNVYHMQLKQEDSVLLMELHTQIIQKMILGIDYILMDGVNKVDIVLIYLLHKQFNF